MLRSAEQVIDALGDTAGVAGLLGLGLSVVSNWKKRQAIPPEYFVALSEALGKRNMAADPAVFKMKSALEE